MNRMIEEKTPYLGVALATFCAVGIIGNIVTLIITTKREAFKSRCQLRLYFGNLAAADLASSLHWLVAALGYFDKKLANATTICHFIAVTRRPLMVLTLLSLTMLSFNRFCAVVKEEKAEMVFSKKRSWLYIAAIWILTFLTLVIPLLYRNKVLMYSNTLGTCMYSDNLAAMVLTTLVIICMIAMGYCNVKTWYVVKQHNKAMMISEVITQEVSRKRKLKLNKITSIIVVTFTISYGLGLILFAIGKGLKWNLSPFWARLMYVVYATNFANNVFVYGVLDKDYRKEVKRVLFGCETIRSRVSPTNTSTESESCDI